MSKVLRKNPQATKGMVETMIYFFGQHAWTQALGGLCLGMALLAGSGALGAEAQVKENNTVFQYSISNPGYSAE